MWRHLVVNVAGGRHVILEFSIMGHMYLYRSTVRQTASSMVLHNPNNWHWVDKNCLPWAREYFAANLLVESTDGETTVGVSEVKSVEGDVEVCQRKGKVISLFDVALELSFKGNVGEETVSGSIKIPEVSYDSDEDDYQFTIVLADETAAKAPAKALVRSKIVPELRKRLQQFGLDLIAAHGKDIQHVSQVKTTAKLPEASSIPAANEDNTQGTSGSGKTSTASRNSSAYNTVKLSIKRNFTASAEQLYKAFLDPQMVSAWSRAKSEIRPEVGAKFELFGGNITGSVSKLDEPKLIVQEWRLRSWKPEHFAELSLKLDQGSSDTVLTAEFDGIPVGQEELVEANFDNYYVRPIMLTFGFGIPAGSV